MTPAKRENDGETYTCSHCSENYQSKDELLKHYSIHEQGPACKRCKKVFKTFTARRKHCHLEHGDVSLQCRVCEIVYYKARNMRLHKGFHERRSPYLCFLCLLSFKSVELLKDHLMKHENKMNTLASLSKISLSDSSLPSSESESETRDIKVDKKNICHYCGKGFSSKGTMNRHMNIHQPKGEFRCDFCDRVFDLKDRLEGHIKRNHSGWDHKSYPKEKTDNAKVDKKKKSLLCHICGKSYKDARGLRRHKEFHAEKGSFECKVCNKIFDLNIKLKLHVKQNHKFSCKCSFCGKVFNRKDNYKTHMSIHYGHKPFSCSYCNASYVDRSNLKKHISKHPEDVGAKVIVNTNQRLEVACIPDVVNHEIPLKVETTLNE